MLGDEFIVPATSGKGKERKRKEKDREKGEKRRRKGSPRESRRVKKKALNCVDFARKISPTVRQFAPIRLPITA